MVLKIETINLYLFIYSFMYIYVYYRYMYTGICILQVYVYKLNLSKHGTFVLKTLFPDRLISISALKTFDFCLILFFGYPCVKVSKQISQLLIGFIVSENGTLIGWNLDYSWITNKNIIIMQINKRIRNSCSHDLERRI